MLDAGGGTFHPVSLKEHTQGKNRSGTTLIIIVKQVPSLPPNLGT
jgi:hypothetical protein